MSKINYIFIFKILYLRKLALNLGLQKYIKPKIANKLIPSL